MKFRALVLLMVFAGLVGCSDDSGSGSFVSSDSHTQLPNLGKTIVGVLYLGVQVGGARVAALDRTGQTLAQTTADASGNFFLRGNFPRDFRVVDPRSMTTGPSGTKARTRPGRFLPPRQG